MDRLWLAFLRLIKCSLPSHLIIQSDPGDPEVILHGILNREEFHLLKFQGHDPG